MNIFLKDRRIFISKINKRLLSNFFSLSVVQGTNLILPLLTLPYLIRVLGFEYFGLLAFANAVIAYFNIITDYGFNLTATKDISLNRNKKDKINEIFSSVMTIKIVLLFLSFIFFAILVFSINKFSDDWEIYFLTFGTVIGQTFFPIWFFQGVEKMKYITYLNLLSKSIFTIAIFIFVHEPIDFYRVPILTSIGSIIAGFYSLRILNKKFNVRFQIQSVEILKTYFKDGWHVFISRFYASAYTTTNIIILGFFTNDTSVGIYSIIQKIVAVVGNLFEPANRTIYPYLVRKFEDDFNVFLNLIKKTTGIFLVIALLLFVAAEFFRNDLIYLVSGNYDDEISLILGFFLLKILIYPFGSLFSNALIIMKRRSEFMKVMNFTVLIDIILVPISIYFFNVMGLVISFLIVSYTHVFLLIYYLFKSIQIELKIDNLRSIKKLLFDFSLKNIFSN